MFSVQKWTNMTRKHRIIFKKESHLFSLLAQLWILPLFHRSCKITLDSVAVVLTSIPFHIWCLSRHYHILLYIKECFSGKKTTRKLKFIRNYIRDLSRVFSISSLREDIDDVISFWNLLFICAQFAKLMLRKHGERYIREVIWSWHKIVLWRAGECKYEEENFAVT